MNRREFVASAAGMAVAGRSSAWAAAEPNEPIIDTHVHLWDLNKLKLPWLAGAGKLNHDHLWSDYAKASQGLNVVQAVYMEVDADPSHLEKEANLVSALCEQTDNALAAVVIGGRPASEGFADYLREMSRKKAVKGVRQVLHGPSTPPGFCLEPAFIKGIQLLGKHDLSFDLCLRPGELGDGAKLIQACPDTRFILDHCGNADVFASDLGPWKSGIEAVAKQPNVACKVSGIIVSTAGREWKAENLAPVVNFVLDQFGPDRVVFGGDWPVCTLGAPLAEWVNALKEIVRERSAEDRRKLFHDNAQRVYRLAEKQ